MTIASEKDQTIQIGESIGSQSRDTGFANWNRYAAVNDEFVPIHMDDEAGRAAGMPGAFGMGNLQLSYLHALLREWAGDGGRIKKLAVQFRKPNTKGRVTATGIVTGVTTIATGSAVELEVWTENESGDRLATGTATVEFA
ncbi:MaoC/PaaZ C-terminal domain-containing protein [Microbacterium sp.]|uniref:MaoC/PaaZ C-terminal domain-containing protein n=1 Tax=Microbacterium sp. TaxID=51671 RepID=UPI002736440C|nr:MaoC/PaaZ C-terminal domain-containing protein [Microbacterium sp.]MDP3950261.1 MaoC/PaaZ C-terminal domain-containing protein [Microbacterium sp.]